MLVTALTGELGYDRAGKIAKAAERDGSSLREAALKEGVAAEVFDRCIHEALERIVAESRSQLGSASKQDHP
jgi:fumarate hydratase class II